MNKYIESPITKTLEDNYMPYAMSVIVSRALPEIDGFKPSHRKLLYMMYTMGLLTGNRLKSNSVVGQTMKLNPHGDAAIYDTLVRLSKGNESLLVPFVDSKGNFGKIYSRDMAYAASRYTEVKLTPICRELFSDIDSDSVDFVDNYDGTLKEPTLLPTTYPNILTNATLGIAVGMACSICGFDLNEVCRTAIEYIKDPSHDILSTLHAPDFPTGGELIFDRKQIESIYNTGKGSIRLRAKWNYVKKENIIEVTEIPYTTTIEAIIDKVADLIKQGKLKEISDIRDETGLNGLKIAIDLKRGTDPDKLMKKLMRTTPLSDVFSCNFNILIGGMPRVLGIPEILEEWVAWRSECVKRKLHFELGKKKDKLHLLKGLSKILLDIDRAIAIIRNTEEEEEVVPNLMIGFGIDEKQAEFIAEIKLRNINKAYIIKRMSETEALEKDIADIESTLSKREKVLKIIISDLENIIKRYPTKRRTEVIYDVEDEEEPEDDPSSDYQVHIFLSKEGYFKKITPLSLRMSKDSHKLKDGDSIIQTYETTNNRELIVFTNRAQAYKCRLNEFEDGKISALGEYLPQKLSMDEGEVPIAMFLPEKYESNLIFVFENGKIAKVPMIAYETKSNRRRLTNAYADKSSVCGIFEASPDVELALYSGQRLLIVNTAVLQLKTTRTTQGVSVMNLKKGLKVDRACLLSESGVTNTSRYKTRTLPSAGALLKDEDLPEKQLTLE